MRRASPVDGLCDEPWETEASLILHSHWLNEPSWPGKRDYMKKSGLARLSCNRGDDFCCV